MQERLAGNSHIAVGTSTVVAGDIKINLVDPSLSEVGEIVVNVEVFESDSNLRDKRIRHDYLGVDPLAVRPLRANINRRS